MKLLKVKDFRTYQPVRLGQDLISTFIDSDESKVANRDNDAFYVPDMGVILLKNTVTKVERCVPQSNIQDFTLYDELLKKAAPEPEKPADLDPVVNHAPSLHGDALASGPSPSAALTQQPDKKASKKVSKKAGKKTQAGKANGNPT